MCGCAAGGHGPGRAEEGGVGPWSDGATFETWIGEEV